MISRDTPTLAEVARRELARRRAARPASNTDVLRLARALSSIVHVFTDLVDAQGATEGLQRAAGERIRAGLQAATEEFEHLNLDGAP